MDKWNRQDLERYMMPEIYLPTENFADFLPLFHIIAHFFNNHFPHFRKVFAVPHFRDQIIENVLT